MKFKILSIVFLMQLSLAKGQQTHEITVSINQPEICASVLSSQINATNSIFFDRQTQEIALKFNDALYYVAVFDLSGKKCAQKMCHSQNEKIDASQFKHGIYVVHVITIDQSITHKILVDHR